MKITKKRSVIETVKERFGLEEAYADITPVPPTVDRLDVMLTYNQLISNDRSISPILERAKKTEKESMIIALFFLFRILYHQVLKIQCGDVNQKNFNRVLYLMKQNVIHDLIMTAISYY